MCCPGSHGSQVAYLFPQFITLGLTLDWTTLPWIFDQLSVHTGVKVKV